MANRKWWQLLGGIWFVLYGLLAVSSLTITGANIVMGFMAIIVGLLFLWDR
jgi:uncharacterized membrane protein